MQPWQVPLVVLAGIGAGLTGSIAGLASLISYPALLAIGLPPITANVTNTVALVFGGVGSVLGSRPELTGQARRVRRLAGAGVLGGAAGAVALLATPPGAFERIVPWLIAAASVTILAVRRPAAPPDGPARPDRPVVVGLVFLVGVYGGYFGAAAGVLLLALFLAVTAETVACSNALKNVVLGLANLVAGVLFAVDGAVDWAVAVTLGVGVLAGSRMGPVVVRRVPPRPLRVVIALAGLGLAVRLAYGAYR